MDYLSQAVVCRHSFSALGRPGSLRLAGDAELEGQDTGLKVENAQQKCRQEQ